MSTLMITNNTPIGQPVFDFDIGGGRYARVDIDMNKSADGLTLYARGWAYLIDANGVPALDGTRKTPIATNDGQNTIALSDVLAGTKSLRDGWCKYVPASGETINAQSLPQGWTVGTGAPTGTPAYGTKYYDAEAEQPWVYNEGLLVAVARGYADQLAAQIDTAEKLASLGI